MKNSILLIITVTLLFTLALPVNAATVAPTSAPQQGSNGKLNNQINNLKEKIASRVSELNLVEKRGMIGTVSEVEGNQITLLDPAGKRRFVDVDELTKFSSNTGGATFGLSDMKKGVKISVIGVYNKQSRHLLARFIRTSIDPAVIPGTVTALDAKNFIVTITTDEQKQQKIDMNTITKTYTYQGEGLTKAGFSQIKVGERILATGFPDKKDPTLLTASRVLIFPGLPKDPNIIIDQPAASSSAKQ